MTSGDARPPERRPPNGSADRVLRILSAFRDAGGELGVTDLSQALDLDKSVVHRILGTLAAHHFLDRNPETRKYRVGLRAWEVGRRYTVRSWVDEAAVPLLADLVSRTGGTAYVGSLDGSEIVYLATVDGAGPIRVHVDVGARTSAHTTALGRAILAALPDDDLATLLEQIDLPTRPNPKAGRTRSALLAELEVTRERGYAINRGESRPGVGAVGAPVRDSRGTPVAALSVGFPMMPEYEQLWEIVPPQLVRVAAEVTRRMG